MSTITVNNSKETMTQRQAYVGALALALVASTEERTKKAIKLAAEIGSGLSEDEKETCKALASLVLHEVTRKDLFYISFAGKVLDGNDIEIFETEEARTKYIRDYLRELNDEGEGNDVYASTEDEIFDFALAYAQKKVETVNFT